MHIQRIESLDDPRLAPYRDLKATNLTRDSNTFVAEGDKLVRRLLASDFPVESLLVAESLLTTLDVQRHARTSVLAVPDGWVERIVGFNFHRGLLACARRKPSADLRAHFRASADRLTLVVCPDVQDPENLGAILRISAAFGVDAVVLGSACADPFSRRVLRVSMGASLRLPIARPADLPAELAALRQDWQLQLWATVADRGAPSLEDSPRPQRLAILLGSEGHGLDSRWLGLCDRQVTIPMQGGIDSLNVAVAAGIALYRLMR